MELLHGLCEVDGELWMSIGNKLAETTVLSSLEMISSSLCSTDRRQAVSKRIDSGVADMKAYDVTRGPSKVTVMWAVWPQSVF